MTATTMRHLTIHSYAPSKNNLLHQNTTLCESCATAQRCWPIHRISSVVGSTCEQCGAIDQCDQCLSAAYHLYNNQLLCPDHYTIVSTYDAIHEPPISDFYPCDLDIAAIEVRYERNHAADIAALPALLPGTPVHHTSYPSHREIVLRTYEDIEGWWVERTNGLIARPRFFTPYTELTGVTGYAQFESDTGDYWCIRVHALHPTDGSVALTMATGYTSEPTQAEIDAGIATFVARYAQ